MSDKPVVAVLYANELPPGRERLEAMAAVRYATVDGLADAVDGADALFLWDFFSTAVKDVWDRAGSLKWIHVAAAGVDKLMFDELADSDVVVTNSGGIFDRPIAEFVLGSMLSFAKDMPLSFRLQSQKVWRHRETERLDDKSAVIVGTGAIGREIARLLAAVDVSVAGAGRTARSGDEDFGEVYESARLAEYAGDFDYVIVVAPLTPATRNLVDADVLAAMKPTARLINVGRGESVDADALADALSGESIAGAALDVFSPEPLPESSPLWEMDNVLVSPHMSGDAVGWLERLSDLFAANLDRYCRDAELVNIVDKRLGFVPR
ncbi:D-2-hydroxyacid dehydrogenase [Spelaeicoccus albus]|uniref:Phosphoglycerate dehydrogenase-like enzyme n=1 Tax=Spelaeicoccus albus TaxID=1280376 RepID=A0A7Z0A921_9MICO|nr:D-2-hydroxyacid dehydrogenase [Spelaeicoccus albus]NYI66637.1 phosphoglycerate dehydrogenase-like enzyme [Spelaeicoccus albus]